MRKPIIILTVFFTLNVFATVFYSCSKRDKWDTCNGLGNYKSHYCAQLKSVAVEPIQKNNNGVGYSAVESGSAVRYNQFVLSVTLTGEEIVCRRMSAWPFTNTALACSPVVPVVDFKGTIDSITIISDNDFDDAHPTGTDISKYFDINENYLDPNLVESEGSGTTGSVRLALQHPPSANNTFAFTVIYHLADGNKIKGACASVNIER